ncbi:MAG: bifunctional (p)ppGpp synthetase/guanosine-3',5'-bis(diphosphate) 3'-pyrophosphohydrolase [Micromonosporaceae bacterium]|nr:bifunctional (p)ppGpp synthetase/guanosine-3',5'-bis(diphosphate) 3'-pyrophosphohydrolase [Micromonosporaceae bacterium]
MDLTAGAGSAAQRVSAPAAVGPAIHEGRFGRRLRSLLPWPNQPGDPVGGLLRAHRQQHPRGNVALLRKGYLVADRMHHGQLRKSGEPYITHPLAVARILADLGMDTTTLVAALLHDTVEDTSYTLEELTAAFGGEVALLVDGVTKFDKVYFGANAEAETIRKMLVRAGKDIRVLVIKMADRLHNMQTLAARSPASRARIARATSEVLVPLCDRLGIQALKRQLEDAVLWTLEPEWYARIDEHRHNQRDRAGFLSAVIGTLQSELNRAKITATVTDRPRHYYSIWKDSVAAGHDDPHDLPRVVIVVDGRQTDCYAALGTVHTTWRPVPGRFKDFIASPKNNLYRSLHTTVLGPGDQPLEVLIRTEPMHKTAEYGIVVNFRDPEYTARLSRQAREEQVAWLKRVLDWQSVAEDATSFLDALRCDLTEGQVQVFTTDGRRIQLPSGSTPVDLAYALSTETGHGCVGAKRDGRLVPLGTPLADGEVVEIISENRLDSGPSREWLSFVRTPAAQLQINLWFQQVAGETGGGAAGPDTVAHRVQLGMAALSLALRHRDRGLGDDRLLLSLAGELGYPDQEALLVAVAEDRIPAGDVADRLISSVDRSPVDEPPG